MHCPNCRHILTKIDLNGIEVEHCNNCGGTLFEANEINRVTKKDAERLALIKQTDVISAAEKISPRDGSLLKRIEEPSIPQHVTLLESETTGEVFAYADDLVAFKEAQSAKINYYKTWRLPMPQVQNVLVFSLAILATASIAYMVSLVQTPTSQSIQAQTLCRGGVTQIRTETGHIVSCTTPVDLSCQVSAECQDGQRINLTCTDNTYFGTVEDDTCTQVRFIYEDNTDSIQTDWIILE